MHPPAATVRAIGQRREPTPPSTRQEKPAPREQAPSRWASTSCRTALSPRGRVTRIGRWARTAGCANASPTRLVTTSAGTPNSSAWMSTTTRSGSSATCASATGPVSSTTATPVRLVNSSQDRPSPLRPRMRRGKVARGSTPARRAGGRSVVLGWCSTTVAMQCLRRRTRGGRDRARCRYRARDRFRGAGPFVPVRPGVAVNSGGGVDHQRGGCAQGGPRLRPRGPARDVPEQHDHRGCGVRPRTP